MSDKSFVDFSNFIIGDDATNSGVEFVTLKHLGGKHDQSLHGLHGNGEPTPAQLSARKRAAAGRERKRQAAAGQPVGNTFVDRFGKSEAPNTNDASVMDLVNKADYYAWHNFDYEATALKHQVATNLSQGAKIDYAEASDSVHMWAISANDSNVNSLNMQRVAGEIFGANFTGWQKQNYDSIVTFNKHSVGSRNTILSDDETKSFLKTMYQQTQAELKAAGIKEVVVYRGVAIDENAAVNYKNAMRGDKIKIEMNAMSSWSTKKEIADGFGYINNNRFVFAIKVPASRVMATAHTGFGCYSEREYVLLGDPAGDMVSIVGGKINGINL